MPASGATWRNSGGGEVRCSESSSVVDGASNGRCPVSISYKITPEE
jgi:hypothetical protein